MYELVGLREVSRMAKIEAWSQHAHTLRNARMHMCISRVKIRAKRAPSAPSRQSDTELKKRRRTRLHNYDTTEHAGQCARPVSPKTPANEARFGGRGGDIQGVLAISCILSEGPLGHLSFARGALGRGTPWGQGHLQQHATARAPGPGDRTWLAARRGRTSATPAAIQTAGSQMVHQGRARRHAAGLGGAARWGWRPASAVVGGPRMRRRRRLGG